MRSPLLRVFVPLAIAATLAACGEADLNSRAATAQPSSSADEMTSGESVAAIEQPAAEIVPLLGPDEEIHGWVMSPDGYQLFNTITPGFRGSQHKGGLVSQDTLRGKWTIMAFWGLWSEDSLAEARYLAALSTAAKQDRGLNFLSVHTPPGPERGDEALGGFLSLDSWFADNGGAWPTLMDRDGRIAATFAVDTVPKYLLIGPDLTIEAWRGPIAGTSEDGIKSAIRGVAEIKKQIAAPG